MKKKNLFIVGGAGLLAIFGFTMAGFSMNNTIAYAEGEESEVSEVISESEEEETSQPVVIQVVEEKENGWFKNIWETYLLPAILSINVGAIVSALTSIVFAIKNSRTHKDYNAKLANVVTAVASLTEQTLKYVAMLGERNQQVKDLLLALENADETVKKQMALIEEQKGCYEDLKNSVVALINLQTELVKNNPELVKNGLAMQIVEIKNNLMKVMG